MGLSIVRACMVVVGLALGLGGIGQWEAKAGGMMYWTDLGISKIQCVNLDGTGLRDLVVTDLRFPGASRSMKLATRSIGWIAGRVRSSGPTWMAAASKTS